jgi:hypothetical protein
MAVNTFAGMRKNAICTYLLYFNMKAKYRISDLKMEQREFYVLITYFVSIIISLISKFLSNLVHKIGNSDMPPVVSYD